MAEIGNQIWSGRIVDAHYTNPEHDTVEILYRQVHPDEPSGTDADIKKEFYLKKGNIEKYKIKTRVVSHYVVVDETDEQFKDLLKEVSYEELERRTLENNEGVRQEFRIAFDNYAKENGLYNYAENPIRETEIVKSNVDEMIFDFDESDKSKKEDLFKLKLKIFERDEVKDSDDRATKAEIRKSKTPLDVLVAYKKILDKK